MRRKKLNRRKGTCIYLQKIKSSNLSDEGSEEEKQRFEIERDSETVSRYEEKRRRDERKVRGN